MNSSNERQCVRKELRARRQQLTPGQRLMAADQLATTLEQLPEMLTDQHIAGYWAIAGEISLHAVVARLLARNQSYFLPKIQNARQLHFAPWRMGQALITNRYGIPEPELLESQDPHVLDIVLVPLLGFDRRGHRLGTGGGYYDYSFAFLHEQPRPAKPILVGVGYSFQELQNFASNPWDVSLDYIATERELITCHNAKQR